MRALSIIFLSLLVALTAMAADENMLLKPSSRDKCPVCGMFVYKYPDFLTQIIFKDGSVAFFDGAKDMFKYYLDIQKYNPKQKQTDIAAVYVTDYYSLALIDGMKAAYVAGSDVFGPMGRELISFEKDSEAKGFLKDHKGKSLIKFQDVTYSIVKGLD